MKTWKAGLSLMVAAWAVSQSATAMAQTAPYPGAPQNNAMPPAAIMMNPYLNPYMNPYLNPGVPQQKMSAGDMAVYMYAAQSARGGIGSGRISNARLNSPRTKAAEMPDSASTPGGGAARYFNPGPRTGAGASRYYNRRGNYFMNNGR